MMTGAARGVVLYHDGGYEAEHERVVHVELARQLAELQGMEFLGDYQPSGRQRQGLYFVPAETLVGLDKARRLGIASERDLFGGVVPQAFVATKSISHPLIRPGARAPAGWSASFNRRVSGAVLAGFTAFTLEDARRAGLLLLERGPVRIKAVLAKAGHGQWEIAAPGELRDMLDWLDAGDIARVGLVLEENLAEVQTYSIGQVRVGDQQAAYFGTQRLTEDNSGALVYGGSELVVTRGGFGALHGLALPTELRHAITQAQAYDAAALECFPGLLASRRNYDVAVGLNGQGQRCSGVLEQSWRIGGASSAEIAALKVLQSTPTLQVVRAASLEFYGSKQSAPAGAAVLFSGLDPEVGSITKCVSVEAYGGA